MKGNTGNIKKNREVDFNIEKNDVIAITGGGGKTSLIYYLAEVLSKTGRVLVTTTTKIYKPEKKYYENLFVGDAKEKGTEKNIDVAAEKEKEGKLIGLSYEEIDRLRRNYDYILIEADGAKERAVKGWREDEPCIPNFVTKTIGVASIKSVGKKIDYENIHRLEIFCEQTGTDLQKEKKISLEVMKRYLEKGYFHRRSKGENILFLNAVEDEKKFEKALVLGKEMENFYFGSIQNRWIKKLKKIDAVVMASGYSRRFGTEDKLLTEVDGKPCIENLLLQLKKLPFSKVVVVGRKERIRLLAEKHGCIFVENKDAHLGQSESVKLGIKNADSDAVTFFPGDQPYLKKREILEIIEKYQKSDEITLPIVEGKPNTPVIFPLRYRDDLLALEGDTGGREIIRGNIRTEVVFEQGETFKDIDSIEDIKSSKKD